MQFKVTRNFLLTVSVSHYCFIHKLVPLYFVLFHLHRNEIVKSGSLQISLLLRYFLDVLLTFYISHYLLNIVFFSKDTLPLHLLPYSFRSNPCPDKCSIFSLSLLPFSAKLPQYPIYCEAGVGSCFSCCSVISAPSPVARLLYCLRPHRI